jgi:hypothetical protein
MRTLPAVAVVALGCFHIAAIRLKLVTVAALLSRRYAIELKHIIQMVVTEREDHAPAL